MPELRPLGIARRELERSRFMRWLLGGGLLSIGAIIATVNPIAGGAIAASILPLARNLSRKSQRRRLADARRHGLRGRVIPRGPSIVSRYEHRPCVAFWARARSTESETVAEAWRVSDFAIECAGGRYEVDSRDVELVVDSSEPVDATQESLVFEEVVILPGDEVVVWGTVEAPPEGGPFREGTARITRRGKQPVLLGLPPPVLLERRR